MNRCRGEQILQNTFDFFITWKVLVVGTLNVFIVQKRSQCIFFWKEPGSKYFDFVGNTTNVANIQLCYFSMKAPICNN